MFGTAGIRQDAGRKDVIPEAVLAGELRSCQMIASYAGKGVVLQK
jgi:hypothetical protein